MSNISDEKLKRVGFTENERLLIAKLYKPIIERETLKARKDEVKRVDIFLDDEDTPLRPITINRLSIVRSHTTSRLNQLNKLIKETE